MTARTTTLTLTLEDVNALRLAMVAAARYDDEEDPHRDRLYDRLDRAADRLTP